MKITGLILALIGLVAIAICTIQIVEPSHPAAEPAQRPNMIVPMAISGAAGVIGALMFIFGGRGYFVSNNPRVRN